MISVAGENPVMKKRNGSSHRERELNRFEQPDRVTIEL
jgi:hypothetical protein